MNNESGINMKNSKLLLILIAFLIFLLNCLVFFGMSAYVEKSPTFMNQVMLYLTVIIIVGSGFISFMGYKDLSQFTLKQKITAHVVFSIHMLGLALFVGTIWFVNR